MRTEPFFRIGEFVYAYRRAVVIVGLLLCALSGLFGADLGSRFTDQGWFDETTESVKAAELIDGTFGRDTNGDVVALYTAADGRTVDDPEIAAAARAAFRKLKSEFGDHVQKVDSYWDGLGTADFADTDHKHAFASIGLRGSGAQIVKDYRAIRDQLEIPGLTLEQAGIQPIVAGLDAELQRDIHRAELVSVPAVLILILLVFGSLPAALLPLLVGGLAIAATAGVLRGATEFMPINNFVGAIVTLVSLGLAIDYGLFMVSRFREELSDHGDVGYAVAKAVATSGRTVCFSAAVICASIAALLTFHHPILRSVAAGGITAVTLAAILSITILPAVLGLLGHRINALSVPRGGLVGGAERRGAELDSGAFGRLADWSMRRPRAVALTISAVLLAMAIPFAGMSFGGLSERYLAPSSPARIAQTHFDGLFPQYRTQPVRMVVIGANPLELNGIRDLVNTLPHRSGPAAAAHATEIIDGKTVNVFNIGLPQFEDAEPLVALLRSIEPPAGVQIMVTGIPVLERDSIDSMLSSLPTLLALLALATFALLMMAFRAVALAVRAVLMSALSLTASLGLLVWIFVKGHGASWLGVEAQPLNFAVMVIVVAVIFGLSTDYEVFVVSRMVERRRAGDSTASAIRYGVAHTGGIITAAALVMIVVVSAFGLSDILIMKCIAIGMIIALIIDATIIRLMLVPALMAAVGDRIWWPMRVDPPGAQRVDPPDAQRVDASERPAQAQPANPQGG